MKKILHHAFIECYVVIIVAILTMVNIFPSAQLDDYLLHVRGYLYSKETKADYKIPENHQPISAPKNEPAPDNLTVTEEIEKSFDRYFEYGSKMDSDSGGINIIKNALHIQFFHDHPVLLIMLVVIILICFYALISWFIRWLFKKGYMTHKRIVICFVILFLILCRSLWGSFFKQDYLKDHYISPQAALSHSHPEDKKNIILIYVESLEHAWADQTVFNENILLPLQKLGGIQMKITPNIGTTNTLSGVFSSLCGYPLYAGYAVRDKNIRDKEFTSQKMCLGNLLMQVGYKNMAIHGMRTDYFFNKDFEKIFKKNQMKTFDCNALKAEGHKIYGYSYDGCYHNQEVLASLEMKLQTSHKSSQQDPFFITSFLVDTHSPDGFFSEACHNSETNDALTIRGSFKCAVRHLSERIQIWKEKGYLDNTAVVIMGDHPFMPTWKHLSYFQKKRFVYFQILGLDQEKWQPKRDIMNHFDIFPTLLDITGHMKQRHNKVALGSSLFRSDKSYEDRQKHLEKEYYLFSDL